MHFQLGYDYVVQDVGDDLLGGDVLGLGFVGESDAVTQYVVADGPHVLRNHVTPAADEGVGAGGPHAPYRQSERREIYLKYALQLVEAGWAYYAFDTAEELDALRREAEGRGEAFAYNYTVREKLATSLALPAEEVRARIDRGDQWVIRFRMPENEVVEMDDLILSLIHI
mgnify:CR=1 FL=1